MIRTFARERHAPPTSIKTNTNINTNTNIYTRTH
jgi:hypothetical protein